MSTTSSSLPASAPVFAIMSALVEEHAGLHYGLADRDVFVERVSARALDAGFSSLLDYYYFLRYDPSAEEERRKLIDALVVNETYFFRELEPLRIAVQHFILPLVREGKRPRVWSAACSTGEEPLTLAMLLHEADLLSQVDLVATDISQRVLDRAESGRFRPRSLRDAFDPELASRWIKEDGAGGFTVSAKLRNAVQWKCLNLLDAQGVSSLGRFDVVFCRNVLIYFGDETLVRVLRSFADVLKPEGVLFVGISESLLRFGNLFRCEEKNRVFFYRRGE